ncbi:halocyanin domain-containing protein [Saliphagus infecundisoli]|uniref:Halocyanin domain-containing protein n=1 Tax=Saliphagus infecundisoli TaxID=1849069 RepID=A0ABD5QHH8_9EURY|nr:halocyanin domain-containing protein [Saliphagus infecundisoli]
MRSTSRRPLLVACAFALAGCLGEDDPYADEEMVENEPDYGGWLGNADHPGTVDRTGEGETGVEVGAGRDGLAFFPTAIRVDRGTTVVWEWTGAGGRHNVVEREGTFESDQTGEAGHTFEHKFEAEGRYAYICTPHERQGMKGAVDVV